MKEHTFPRMHVSYNVSDINKTVEFYTKFFSIQPVKVKTDYAKFILSEPSLNISFTENTKSIRPGFIHFGIEVNDTQSLKQKLGNAMSQNLLTDIENDVKCCYAKQDKFWVTDPDGYKWEVFHFKEDVEENDDRSFQNDACCVPENKNQLKEEACC